MVFEVWSKYAKLLKRTQGDLLDYLIKKRVFQLMALVIKPAQPPDSPCRLHETFL